MSTEVRPARPEEEEAVIALSARLAAGELPPWRTPGEVERATTATLRSAFRDGGGRSALFVADATGEVVGFLLVMERPDYFRGEPLAYIGAVAVSEGAMGSGVAESLMAAAAAWARERGHDRLSLNVFAGNGRARRFYERLGYAPESLSYVKMLD